LKPSSSITTAFTLEEDVVLDTLEDDLEFSFTLDEEASLPLEEELPRILSMSSRVSDDELDKVSSSGEVDEWSSEEQAEKKASERADPSRTIFFIDFLL
jgi:hypothetical protein